MKKLLLIFSLTILPLHDIWGYEYWSPLEDVPWSNDQRAIISFKGYLYVSARHAKDSSNTKLWRTKDGINWTPLHTPDIDNIWFQTWTVFDGTLFAFGRDDIVNAERRLFTTTDGLHWEARHVGQFGIGQWTHAIEFKDKVVAADHEGGLYRVDQNTFEKLNWDPVDGSAHIHFAVSHGFLYMAHDAPPGPGGGYRAFSRTQDGIIWEKSVYTTYQPDPDDRLGFAQLNDQFFWARSFILRRSVGDHQSFSFAITQPNNLPSMSNNSPFVVQGKLHNTRGSFGPLVIYQINSDFSKAYNVLATADIESCTFPNPKFNHVADVGERSFFLSCKLWTMTIDPPPLSMKPIHTGPYTAGQRGRKALEFSVDVQAPERLMQLTIKNNGTAENELDINRIQMFLSGQPKGELIPQGNQTWKMASPLLIDQDAELSFDIDLSPTARDGKTIQFIIPAPHGLIWESDSTYSYPSSLKSVLKAERINGVVLNQGAGEIKEVNIFPKPSRDVVRFQYTLPTAADVIIHLFDRNGLLVSEINELSKSASTTATTIWDATNKGAGVYYATIRIKHTNGEERFYKRKVYVAK